MSVSKISEIPPDLEFLLRKNTKEVTVIGSSAYEIYPLHFTKLMDVIADLLEIVCDFRNLSKNEGKEELAPEVFLEYFSKAENRTKILNLLEKVVEGVSPEDYREITFIQLVHLITKVISVNISGLPEEVRGQAEQVLAPVKEATSGFSGDTVN
ncbi:hypothetical protein DRN58_01950 [Thermococci archaeon]|nr:MAG: hypothetical protein DRN58_01950 [Thermococci archaeon]